MDLSASIVKGFISAVSDVSSHADNSHYGTASINDGEMSVVLDGASIATPCNFTVDVSDGDRVAVSFKDHEATVTGNLSNPSIGVMEKDNLRSAITQTEASISLEVSRASEAEGELRSLIRQTDDSIVAEVSRASQAEGVLQSRIVQTAASITATVSDALEIIDDLETRVEQNESSISQTSQEIALTVRKDDLISSINQTAESIKIEASKIDLVGAVTADDIIAGTLKDQTNTNSWNLNTGKLITKDIAIESGFIGTEADGFAISSNRMRRMVTDSSNSSHRYDYFIQAPAANGITSTNVFGVRESNDYGDNWFYNFRVRADGALFSNNCNVSNGLKFEKDDKPGYYYTAVAGSGVSTSGYSIDAYENWYFAKKITGTITNADKATSATSAGYATSAGSATSATSAGYATSAGSATSATSASSATKASQTSSGFSLLEIQKGTISIKPSAANTPTFTTVTFPKPFSGTPVITVTPSTGAPGTVVTGVSALNPTNKQFNPYLTRTNTTSTSLYWIAVY